MLRLMTTSEPESQSQITEVEVPPVDTKAYPDRPYEEAKIRE